MNQIPPDRERLVEDMGIRWGRGERVLVESYLSSDPALRDTPEVLLDLIYQEVVLREQQGETPTLEEYKGRFPELASQLVKQFEVHQLLPSRLSLGVLGLRYAHRFRDARACRLDVPPNGRAWRGGRGLADRPAQH